MSELKVTRLGSQVSGEGQVLSEQPEGKLPCIWTAKQVPVKIDGTASAGLSVEHYPEERGADVMSF